MINFIAKFLGKFIPKYASASIWLCLSKNQKGSINLFKFKTKIYQKHWLTNYDTSTLFAIKLYAIKKIRCLFLIWHLWKSWNTGKMQLCYMSENNNSSKTSCRSVLNKNRKTAVSCIDISSSNKVRKMHSSFIHRHIHLFCVWIVKIFEIHAENNM
jgi:hypothetical protein